MLLKGFGKAARVVLHLYLRFESPNSTLAHLITNNFEIFNLPQTPHMIWV